MSEELKIYQRLRSLDEDYRSLHQVWEGFKSAIEGVEATEDLKNLAPSHRVLESPPDEVRFSYLGVAWYARFQHNTKCGSVEYGVFSDGPDRIVVQQVPVLVMEFDKLWNTELFGTKWNLRSQDEARWIHKRFLAEVAPKALEDGAHLGDPAARGTIPS